MMMMMVCVCVCVCVCVHVCVRAHMRARVRVYVLPRSALVSSVLSFLPGVISKIGSSKPSDSKRRGILKECERNGGQEQESRHW